MLHQLVRDTERHVTDIGVPWSVVSQKTGIPYNRLRGLRAGKLEPTFTEAILLCRYCGFEIQRYGKEPAQESA